MSAEPSAKAPWLDHDLFVMSRAAQGLRVKGREGAAERLDAVILRLVGGKAAAYFDALDDKHDLPAAVR